MDGKVWLPILDRLDREREVITVGLEEPQTRGLQRYDPVSSSFPTPSGASSKSNGGFYGKSYFRHVILSLARPATSTQHIGPSITGFRSTKADEGKRRRVVSAGFVPMNQWHFPASLLTKTCINGGYVVQTTSYKLPGKQICTMTRKSLSLVSIG